MRRRAFTLIELLVVIAIIAILAAILFPVFAKAREKARQSSCQSNCKQLALGVLQYAQDYDETYPYMWINIGAHLPPGQTANTNYLIWAEAIYPYVKNTQMYSCPSHPYTQAQMPYSTQPLSYNYPGCAGGIAGVAMANVQSTSTEIMCYDGWTMDAWWAPADQAALISGTPGSIPWTTTNWNTVRVHNNGANCAFMDGHAKWLGQAQASWFTTAADPD